MISVLNRQQLLSGNRFLGLVLLTVSLVSCGALRKNKERAEPIPEEVVIVPDDTVQPPIKTDPDKPKDDKEDDPQIEEVAYTTVNFGGERFEKVPVHDNSFSIAVLLPFHAGTKSSSSDRARSNYMLEYLQGMKLAFDDLKGIGSFYKVHFFDTRNDTAVLRQILKNPKVENADLIIGPTDEKQLRIAAYFANKRKIPLFSPISILEKPWSDNPYFFNLNASNKVQAQAFIAYYKKKHARDMLILVRDGSKFDRGFGAALKELLPSSGIKHKTINFSTYQDWDKILVDGKNVVLHTATNKSNMTYTVNALLPRYKDVILYGPDKWLDFTSVDYKYWQRLNLGFITTDLSNVNSERVKDVRKKFRAKYNGDPSKFSYKGYDHMLFTAEALHAFGKYFPLFLTNKKFDYSNTSFRFTKLDNCFHNQYIQIIDFKENKLSLADME